MYQHQLIWFVSLTLVLAGLSIFIINRFSLQYKQVETTAFMRQAEVLKQTKSKIEFKIETLCKGTDHCGVCDGKSCLVGYMRFLLSHADHPITEEESTKIATLKNKIFDKSEARMILNFLIDYYDHYRNEFEDNQQLKSLRRTAEFIAFDTIIDEADYDSYKAKID